MARPHKTGLDYFPHDVDATTDPKLEPAIMKYGAAAYAFYFIHLEYCYRSEDLSIEISAAETSQIGSDMRAVIQQKLQIDAQTYENILQILLRHGAFDAEYYAETGKLTSNGIKKRATKVLEKRIREADRYEKRISAAETMQAGEFLPLKYRKEKKIKLEKRINLKERDLVKTAPEELASFNDPEIQENSLPATIREKTSYAAVVDLYHSHCPSLPKIQKLTDKRKKAINTRSRGDPKFKIFKQVFLKAEASDFLTGRNGKWAGCNFDWLLNESNMVKVLEGCYDNKTNGPVKTQNRPLEHLTREEKEALSRGSPAERRG